MHQLIQSIGTSSLFHGISLPYLEPTNFTSHNFNGIGLSAQGITTAHPILINSSQSEHEDLSAMDDNNYQESSPSEMEFFSECNNDYASQSEVEIVSGAPAVSSFPYLCVGLILSHQKVTSFSLDSNRMGCSHGPANQ